MLLGLGDSRQGSRNMTKTGVAGGGGAVRNGVTELAGRIHFVCPTQFLKGD